MNAPAAVDFVRAHGTPVEQARLDALLSGTWPSADALAALCAGQRPDGGWPPFWAPDYSSVDATCYRLAQAEQVAVNPGAPPIQRALAFLAGRQHRDGWWEEDEAVAAVAPPWAAPGDPAARLYLAANGGFWLGLWGASGEGALRAADYLRRHLDDSGHLPTFLHAHWLAAGLWYRLGQPETAERVLVYLRARLADMEASHLAWLMNALLIAAVPGQHPLLADAATALARQQQPDGRWVSEDGPERDVHTTLEALRALQRHGDR